MEYRCSKCNILFKNNGACIRHQNNCKLGNHIIEEYNSGISFRDLVIKYHSNFGTIKRFLEDNNVHIRTEEELLKIKSDKSKKIRHSDEVKKIISEKRKQYLKENPDKHPWKKNTKFKSVPCENFKKVLDELNIKYLPEHTPSDERAFSIDISLPQYKIAIEVNGNQHYNRDGSLETYYQEKHDFISNLGYEVHELHYSLFFDRDKMIQLVNSIIGNKPLFDFDYEEYLQTKLIKKKYFCKTCDNEVYRGNDRCKKCYDISRRKTDRPNLDILLKDIEELGYCGTGKKYGVSDASIKKWIKKAS
jgi:hypothetical protein